MSRYGDSRSQLRTLINRQLDIGYRFRTPFNTGFKHRHNQTPTEYRRKQLPA